MINQSEICESIRNVVSKRKSRGADTTMYISHLIEKYKNYPWIVQVLEVL
jgi:hypothetical protein